MENESLEERLREIKNRPPLTHKEKIEARKRVDFLQTEIISNTIRINVLKKLIDVNKDNSINFMYSMKEYEEIYKEYSEIDNAVGDYLLNKIKNKVKLEKESSAWPSDYIPKIEKDIMCEELKIREFFTFNKYFNRRINNLKGDFLSYIRNQAEKSGAYEFLEAIKNK